MQVMSRELFDYLVREKIADGPLVARWRKPGFEILCSMLAVQKGNHNFGTTSHCRVSRSSSVWMTVVQSQHTAMWPAMLAACRRCPCQSGRGSSALRQTCRSAASAARRATVDLGAPCGAALHHVDNFCCHDAHHVDAWPALLCPASQPAVVHSLPVVSCTPRVCHQVEHAHGGGCTG
jgi:G10 protein